jgi:hypothetical protein
MLARRPVSTQRQACSPVPVRSVAARGRRKVTINQAIRMNEPIAAIAYDKVKWPGQ